MIRRAVSHRLSLGEAPATGRARPPYARAVLGRRHFLKAAVGTLAAASLIAANPFEVAAETAVERPLADFLTAQGTTTLFFPPVPDIVGWANSPPTRFALIDYPGLIAAWLQANGGPDLRTQVGGSITERPLADGRAEVTVVLQTQRALAWVSDIRTDFPGPLLFGYEARNLATATGGDPSLTPGLANTEFNVVFNNTAPGAPLPNLVAAFILGEAQPGQELISLTFYANGTGPLHAAAGLGPEGTPGRAIVTQTGVLFRGPFKGATADGFPAERIELRAVGS